ncbi:uncharacterized protein LOC131953884 isoform X2 [Physella acuta]|uniref:uncharacterized protein LOC131953884 isoform X2 n=1 Tax=Physella acuta TaxID=109671 RepID=UPI0027DBC9B0|nr:uncharacterized protein LOC131953884 isoform X2 [Physella acuta]
MEDKTSKTHDKSEIVDADQDKVKDKKDIEDGQRGSSEATSSHAQLKLRDLLRFVGVTVKESISRGIDLDASRFQRETTAHTDTPKSTEVLILKAPGLASNGPLTRANKRLLESALLSCVNSENQNISFSGDGFRLLASVESQTCTPATTSSRQGQGRGRQPSDLLSHVLTGEDKNLGADNAGSPEKVYVNVTDNEGPKEPGEVGLEDECCHGDVDAFLDDSVCSGSIVSKLDTQSEWEMETSGPASPVQDRKSPSLTKLFEDSVVNDPSTLLIQDEADGDRLRRDISQALQVTDLKVSTTLDATKLCSSQSFRLIFVSLVTTSADQTVSIAAAIRQTCTKNKSASFIAIIDKPTDVDLQARGFDDIYTSPIPVDEIRHKYQKPRWMSGEGGGSETLTRETVNTPESTISIESIRTTECSQSSNVGSVSSGQDISDISFSDLKSSFTPAEEKSSYINIIQDRSSPQEVSPPSWCRAEHATKEKQRSFWSKFPACTEKKRRERIKDSCDQLRVLLPYVRGRKTDMASILEMTVDYLKIINAALPQDFQSQVIEIMSNSNPLLESRNETAKKINMSRKKLSRRKSQGLDLSPLGKPLHIVDKKSEAPVLTLASCEQNVNSQVRVRPSSQNLKDNASIASSFIGHTLDMKTMNGLYNSSKQQKNAVSSFTSGNSLPKRECIMSTHSETCPKPKRLQMDITKGAENTQATPLYATSGGCIAPRETKKEIIQDEIITHTIPLTGFQIQSMLTDGDISANRMFSTGHVANSDLYQYQSQISSLATSRMNHSEHEMGPYSGMYFDGAYYHYYPSVQDTNANAFCFPGLANEYVNPNAVVPMTSFNPRNTFSSSHKIEARPSSEVNRFHVNENLDLFNCNLLPNNLKSNHLS